jgi:6-phosphogluconolactonase
MNYKQFFSVSLASLLLAACQKDIKQVDGSIRDAESAKKNGVAGATYVLGNETMNKVIMYSRSAGGELTYAADFPTGGAGNNMGLGSQGALALSDDGGWLIAVNAASNSISSFAVGHDGLTWVSQVSSGGTTPISVTIHNDLVFALNAGGTANISGFHIDDAGVLHPIAGSTKPLSAPSPGPAQVSFVNDGSALVITEKGTNKIISYTVDGSGIPITMHMLTSANPTPFGFAVGKNGLIYVSEAAGGMANLSTVSSYKVGWDGSISLVDGPESASQTAACWVVVTNNGKYVYATNTGSNTISAFGSDGWGNLSVLYGDVPAGTGTTPLDAAMSNNSQYLYVLNAGSHSIEGFSVGSNGFPAYLQTISGLPASAVGLASK